MSDIAAATASPIAPAPLPASSSASSSGPTLWAHGGFSFKDLVDIVNPLQHLPVIGSVYRYLTGDEPSGGARIIGDSIYGGPIGFGVSVVSTALLDDDQGHDLGERVLAKVFGPRDGSDSNPGATAVASAPPTNSGTTVASTAATNAVPTNAAATNTSMTNPMALANAKSMSLPQGVTMPPGVMMPGPTVSGAHAGGQPVAPPAAMNQVFRAAQPAAAPATPEQTFISQNAQLQRQIATGRGTDGSVINGHGVPLELTSNLLPVMPPGGHLTVVGPAKPGATAANAPANTTPAAVPAGAQPNAPPVPTGPGYASPIAQKMMDALAKYQQLKQQEDQQNQQDNARPSTAPKVDLAL